VRKRPEIPEDVFFDNDSSRDDREGEEQPREDQRESSTETEDRSGTYTRVSDETSEGDSEEAPRVGRPPAQEGPKVAVTLYLTEPVAHMLEEVKFLLLTEYDVKTSKSAIADFGLRHGLDDLEAAADDLRRD
jgi:hypothetical protein